MKSINKNSTFSDITEYYLKNCVKDLYAQSTYDSYKSKMYNHVLPEIGSKPLKDVTKFDVQDLIYNLANEKKLSPTSVRLIYCVLHKIINFALDMELLEKDVCRSVKLPKQTRHTPKIYSQSVITNLLAIAKNSFLYIVILLAVRLGLRRSEILSLRWSDLDLRHATVTINNGKSNRSIRTLELSKLLLQVLKDHKSEQQSMLQEHRKKQSGDTLIVCKADGSPYNPTFVSRKFNELLKANDLPLIRLHDLRHSFATHAHNDGMPVKQLARALGHVSAAMSVDTYVDDN